MTKCPYCNKGDYLPNKVYINCEIYGSAYTYPRCKHCSKILYVHCTKSVTVDMVEKAKKGAKSSW